MAERSISRSVSEMPKPYSKLEKMISIELITGDVVSSSSSSIYKLSVNEKCEKIFSEIKIDEFYLVGVYGDRDVCKEKVSQILECSQGYINEEKDSLYLFLNTENKRGVIQLCFKNNDWIFQKPINEKMNGITNFRILWDLCNAIIPCISTQLVNSWYFTGDAKKRHPFIPKRLGHQEVNVSRQQLNNSISEPILISFSENNITKAILASDYNPFCYSFSTYNRKPIKKNLDSLTNTIKLAFSNREDDKITGCIKEFEKYFSNDRNYNVYFDEGFSTKVKSIFKDMLDKLEELFNRIPSIFDHYVRNSSNLKKKISTLYFFNRRKLEENLDQMKSRNTVINGLIKEIKKDYPKLINARYKLNEKILNKVLLSIVDKNIKEFDDLKASNACQALVDYIIKDIISEQNKIIDEKINQLFTLISSNIESNCGSFLVIKQYLISHNKTLEYNKQTITIKGYDEIEIAQIFNFSVKETFLIIQRPDLNKTHVIFHDGIKKLLIYDSENCGSFDDGRAVIAKGSSQNNFIVVFHESRSVKRGHFEKQHPIIDNEINIFSEEITEIIDIVISESKEKIYIINQNGNVGIIDTTQKKSKCVFVKNTEILIKAPEEIDNLSKSQLLLCALDSLQFFEISYENKDLIILRTSKYLEIYDKNFSRCFQIESISLDFEKTKIAKDEAYYRLITADREKLVSREFSTKISTIVHEKKLIVNNEIPGNPIADIIFLSIKKFGKKYNFLSEGTDIISKSIIYLNEGDKNIFNYIRSLPEILDSFEIQFLNDFSMIETKCNLVSFKNFRKLLLSRVPMHISAIRDGCLVPLQNGFDRIYELKSTNLKNDLIPLITNYIKFGHIENILKEMNNIIVVSIIGKQSSGKSYLLNKLFGCRFDVSAERCTEGIWINIAFSKGEVFLIMDCEGLFSFERNLAEETKLCLFLCAISNVLILNSDLNSSRFLLDIFKRMSNSNIKIKDCENLFNGVLNICIRDVGTYEKDSSSSECMKFIEKLTNNEGAEFVMSFFKGKIWHNSLRNFENKYFEEDVLELFNDISQNSKITWTSGDKLCHNMKYALSYISEDSDDSFDEGAKNVGLLLKIKQFEDLLINMEELKKKFSNHGIKRNIELDESKYGLSCRKKEFIVKIKIFDINYSDLEFYNSLNKQLEKCIFSLIEDSESENEEIRTTPEIYLMRIKLLYHNSFYENLRSIIAELIKVRENVLFDHFLKTINEEINNYEIKQRVKKIKNYIKSARKFNLCPQICQKCQAFCVLENNHNLICDCRTTHECFEFCKECEYDDYKQCAEQKYHKSNHKCDLQIHNCDKKCSKKGCTNSCSKNPDHKDECLCRSSHECKEKCEIYETCRDYCKNTSKDVSHSHYCGSINCPFRCSLCDEKCNTHDHFHKGPHFCDKPHNCELKCISNGVCKVELHSKEVTYEASNNASFTYLYSEQVSIKNKCLIKIPQGKKTHVEKHNCNEHHRCSEKCPDCNVFCSLSAGHGGFHKSDRHRNKVKCFYTSTETEVTKTLNNIQYKIQAGKKASPENCLDSCLSKGRGHEHIIECKGGELCLEKLTSSGVKHCDEQYYTNKTTKIDVDWLDCETYWKHFNWFPPHSENGDLMKNFKLCKAFCDLHIHDNQSISYCTRPIFHNGQHELECINMHTFISSYDIVFIVDNTGSMRSYIAPVKELIKNSITSWTLKGGAKKYFSFIGYTDHGNDSGKYNEDKPIIKYPEDGRMNMSTIDEIQKFINNISCSGGGGNYGEAMIDGLFEARNLAFNDNSKKIFIIVADDCPHGKQFHDNTAYPEGCPCNINWEDILLWMKSNEVDLILVQLSQVLEKTYLLFKEVYGDNIIRRTDISFDDFEEKVSSEIKYIIDKCQMISKRGIENKLDEDLKS